MDGTRVEATATGLVYEDLAALVVPPDDNERRELVDGTLYVSPSPQLPHQIAVSRLVGRLLAWCDVHGGIAVPAPMDVRFAADTVLEPDVLALTAERAAGLADERFVDVVPSLVVEVSSPSTRSFDLLRKRRVYEQFGVAEFWFVDLEAERIEQYVLGAGDGRGGAVAYGPPVIVERGGTVASVALDGLTVLVDEVLDR